MEIELMPKQTELFNLVLSACRFLNQLRYFFFGGAIRGGKTYSIIVVLLFLCKTYPKSKWHIVRKDMTVLKATTIPSFTKLIAGNRDWKWTREAGNYHVTYLPTDAKVFFKPESLSTDPELNDFLGLETNGFFLEQIEELSKKMWDRAIERAGSWYLDKMPPAFIFSSFNPTNRWIKAFVHDKWAEGKLESPYCYIQALTTDNKYVTDDQWKAWENMDEASYRNLIEGSWVFDQAGNTFIYSFRDKPVQGKKPGYSHLIDGLEIDYSLPVRIAFDFNVDPCTALIYQCGTHREWISVIDEIRLANSNIYEVCDHIKANYPNAFIYVRGDASGRNRSAMTKRGLNYYKIIKAELKLNTTRFKIPSINPGIKNSRVLTNSIFAKHPAFLIDIRCKYLIEDIRFLTVDEDGDIEKKKDSHKGHLLDCLRYAFDADFYDFINKYRA